MAAPALSVPADRLRVSSRPSGIIAPRVCSNARISVVESTESRLRRNEAQYEANTKRDREKLGGCAPIEMPQFSESGTHAWHFDDPWRCRITLNKNERYRDARLTCLRIVSNTMRIALARDLVYAYLGRKALPTVR
jgi:hypothetical protein